MQDDDMFILHFYVQKGFTLDYLLNLSTVEKLFFKASLELELEKQEKMLKGGVMIG